jgi:uncharacterized lipoprotein YbaY
VCISPRLEHLFLSLMADGGIYEFAPVAGAERPSPASGTEKGEPPVTADEAVAAPAGAPSIQGTATYRERMALPPEAVLEATLEDVSRADAPAAVIARTRLSSPGNPPFRFEIAYEPSVIQANHSYVVRVRFLIGERLLRVIQERWRRR